MRERLSVGSGKPSYIHTPATTVRVYTSTRKFLVNSAGHGFPLLENVDDFYRYLTLQRHRLVPGFPIFKSNVIIEFSHL